MRLAPTCFDIRSPNSGAGICVHQDHLPAGTGHSASCGLGPSLFALLSVAQVRTRLYLSLHGVEAP